MAANKAALLRCDLCGDCNKHHRAGIYHFINECAHPDMQRLAKGLRTSCLNFLRRVATSSLDTITKVLGEAAEHIRPAAADTRLQAHREWMATNLADINSQLLPALAAAAAEPAPGTPDVWADGDMQMLLYKFILAVPWGSLCFTDTRTKKDSDGNLVDATPAEPPPVVRLSARLFDTIVLPNRALSATCTRWTNLAASHLLKLAHLQRRLRVAAIRQRTHKKTTTATPATQ